jgi:hypothetical protein
MFGTPEAPVTAEQRGYVRGAVTPTVLSGHVAVIGTQNTGKTTSLANVLLLQTYTDNNFIQPVAHTILFSPHMNRQTPFDERHYLSACIDQCCNGSWTFHWGGGKTEDSKPYLTEVAFRAMISAVNRAPGEIIRVVLDDFGDAFCIKEMKWLTSALMLELRHMNVVVAALYHRCSQPFFPVSHKVLFDCFFIFKPAFEAEEELRHIKNLSHGLSGRQFTAAWKFATRIFDANAGDRKNAFIFTKNGNTIAYYAWLNTTTQFHCFKFAAAANMLTQGEDVFETSSQHVAGSPFDKVIGDDGNDLVSTSVCV